MCLCHVGYQATFPPAMICNASICIGNHLPTKIAVACERGVHCTVLRYLDIENGIDGQAVLVPTYAPDFSTEAIPYNGPSFLE